MIRTAARRTVDAFSVLLPGRYRSLPQQMALNAADVGRLSADVERLSAELREQRASVDRAYQALLEELAELSRRRGEDRAELTSIAARTPTGSRAGQSAAPEAAAAAPIRGADLDSFYSGFEERFRGTRDVISAKLTKHLPMVRDADRGEAPILDIGPGRCEWLALLATEKIRAYGIDTNARFVELGTSLGLDVRLGDAVGHLRELPDRSLAGVTAFQVAEHLPMEVLFDLVDHALRALQPGGVLILETPNPLNVVVGASEFWIDPTHLRPLHPQFLEYLLINRGFVDVQVRSINPPDGAFDLGSLGHEGDEVRQIGAQLNRLLYTGCDYVVVGRRSPTTG